MLPLPFLNKLLTALTMQISQINLGKTLNAYRQEPLWRTMPLFIVQICCFVINFFTFRAYLPPP
ncbi:MAG: hypothetical protein COS42_01560 [Flavobacteriales bacterium CG03_land_8_20_14_0_80_35_15]|nr:MAG: hypothetical protein AUJ53_06075 [Flavobacteriaceae bacterium CG1_02_35_72]PIR14484.1 MAG: hypothetical protein COV50_02480 [Flavobacteriales bacterium CG11_big_fil_rev_8_21_14_0_20_35_7]PIV18687.1 MAG: hypothetical protein COS42_01560 [Flavobacteriales bacterium CG03_land_8_20_14_0_80_35_15]